MSLVYVVIGCLYYFRNDDDTNGNTNYYITGLIQNVRVISPQNIYVIRTNDLLFNDFSLSKQKYKYYV